jgi:hypothetical protein
MRLPLKGQGTLEWGKTRHWTPSPRAGSGQAVYGGLWRCYASAQAQQQPTAPSGPRQPPRASAAKALAAPDKIYEPRVIDSLTAIYSGRTPPRKYNAEGWSRQLVQTQLGQDSFNSQRQNRTVGVAIYRLIETPNHGVLSIDGQLASTSGSTLTLRQRSLPRLGLVLPTVIELIVWRQP